VRSWISSQLGNSAQATWSPAPPLSDGHWYWQVRAADSAGNASPWSTARGLNVDTVAPKAPKFTGTVGADGLTLHIDPPHDNVANYVLYVNGVAERNLATTEIDLTMGAFDEDDTRTFSVLAIDTAGNVGAMSATLVGVPNVMGLSWVEALAATSARGLVLKREGVTFGSLPMFVFRQDPTAPALAQRGSSVLVTMSAAKDAPLAVRVSPGRVTCRRGCVLRLRVHLSAAALVRSRLLKGSGRVVTRKLLGRLHAGANDVRVKLPRGLGKGAYRLVLDATADARTARAVVRVNVA
jgi:hypothetical protein